MYDLAHRSHSVTEEFIFFSDREICEVKHYLSSNLASVLFSSYVYTLDAISSVSAFRHRMQAASSDFSGRETGSYFRHVRSNLWPLHYPSFCRFNLTREKGSLLYHVVYRSEMEYPIMALKSKNINFNKA